MPVNIPYNWRPRPYQNLLWQYLRTAKKARAVAVWHRRAGKDLFTVNHIAYEAHKRVGLYWHVFPTYNQGRKIVWQGKTRDGVPFLDYFPNETVASVNHTDMRVNFKNGSIYQVIGTDDPDKLVGSNPIGLVFSEYSIMDPRPWTLLRPVLAENEGWAVFIYTARGKNHGWRLLQIAKNNPKWFAQVLTVEDTKALPLEAIEDERDAGMPEEMIRQEFYCSFDAPIVGSYYGKQMMAMEKEERIGNVPYEPNLEVHTAWDIGIGDSTAIIFYQQHGLECRIIDYYETSGEGLPHYVKMLRERPYVYGRHNAPWDIEVRELGTGKTRLETARTLGLRFSVVRQHRVEDGIESVRSLLPQCWIDEKKCERLIEALRGYRKERVEDESESDDRSYFKNAPVHDWTSHAADAMRYLAFSRKNRSKYGDKKPQETAIDDYAYI